MINHGEPANIDSASSLQAGDMFYFTRVTLFITLLCMGYSLSRPTVAKDMKRYLRLSTTEPGPEVRQPAGIASWQRKTSEKAIEKYANTQGKQWRHWNEAMFERLD